MKALLQRVTHASVMVENRIVGEIANGLLIFLGITVDDTVDECEMLAEKICKLRIFADENDKTNCAINDIGGGLLIVSQFTLCADCRKGTRPSFSNAAPPDTARQLYELFADLCRQRVAQVGMGEFGAHMQIDLCNDGPFTVWLDTDTLKKPRNQ